MRRTFSVLQGHLVLARESDLSARTLSQTQCGASMGHHRSKLPNATMLFADRVVVVDHTAAEVYMLCAGYPGVEDDGEAERWFAHVQSAIDVADRVAQVEMDSDESVESKGRDERSSRGRQGPPPTFELERDCNSYLEDIRECLREIYEGETYEVSPRAPKWILPWSAPLRRSCGGRCLADWPPAVGLAHTPRAHGLIQVLPPRSVRASGRVLRECPHLNRNRTSVFARLGKVCLTNRLRSSNQVDAFSLYKTMRRRNDAPYSAFLRLSPDVSICCSSPERFLRIDTGG